MLKAILQTLPSDCSGSPCWNAWYVQNYSHRHFPMLWTFYFYHTSVIPAGNMKKNETRAGKKVERLTGHTEQGLALPHEMGWRIGAHCLTLNRNEANIRCVGGGQGGWVLWDNTRKQKVSSNSVSEKNSGTKHVDCIFKKRGENLLDHTSPVIKPREHLRLSFHLWWSWGRWGPVGKQALNNRLHKGLSNEITSCDAHYY